MADGQYSCPACGLAFEAPALAPGPATCPGCSTRVPGPVGVLAGVAAAPRPRRAAHPRPQQEPPPPQPPAADPTPFPLLRFGLIGAVGTAFLCGGVLLVVYCLGIASPKVQQKGNVALAPELTPDKEIVPPPDDHLRPETPVVRPPTPTPPAIERGAARSAPPTGMEVGWSRPGALPAAGWVAEAKELAVGGDPRTPRAIDKGVTYLKSVWNAVEKASEDSPAFKRQKVADPSYGVRDGPDPKHPTCVVPLSHPGVPAFLGLTLLECGVPADDPVIQRVAALARRSVPGLANCYALSATILFLDRLGDAADKRLIRQMALTLIGNQRPSGGWCYPFTPITAQERTAILGYLSDGSALPTSLRNLAVARNRPGEVTTEPRGPQQTDRSNTQFAVLALWAARKADVPVERPLELAEGYFRVRQNPDGSWKYWYANDFQTKDASTCAALLGIAASRAAGNKGEKNLLDDPAVAKGLSFLGRTVGKPALPPESANGGTSKNPRGKLIGADSMGDLYFLWSLQRVALIYNLQTIDGKDWYDWGAKHVLDSQADDGSWREWYPGVPDTCFALLFLKRINVVKDLTAKLEALGNIKATAPSEIIARDAVKQQMIGNIKGRGPDQ